MSEFERKWNINNSKKSSVFHDNGVNLFITSLLPTDYLDGLNYVIFNI